MDKLCATCKTVMSCTTDEQCWCNAYPKLLKPDETKNCLCSSCLETELAVKIQKSIKPLSEINQKQIANLGEPKQLKEGLHYSMEEMEGKQMMVLSKWYLLRRGYCCENGCRNCPY